MNWLKCAPVSTATPTQRRAYWLKTMHEWHWISSAVAMIGILLFSITGITLNHAESLESGAQQHSSIKKAVPAALVQHLAAQVAQYGAGQAAATNELLQWASSELQLDLRDKLADWNDREVYFSLDRPGGDAWLKVDLQKSLATYEVTSAGWIAYFNDLHKGRHTGAAWAWFIDILSAACIVFTITGFVILKMHASNRPFTWPLVGFGLLIPFLIAVLLIH
jgi:uncharacterized protein